MKTIDQVQHIATYRTIVTGTTQRVVWNSMLCHIQPVIYAKDDHLSFGYIAAELQNKKVELYCSVILLLPHQVFTAWFALKLFERLIKAEMPITDISSKKILNGCVTYCTKGENSENNKYFTQLLVSAFGKQLHTFPLEHEYPSRYSVKGIINDLKKNFKKVDWLLLKKDIIRLRVPIFDEDKKQMSKHMSMQQKAKNFFKISYLV